MSLVFFISLVLVYLVLPTNKEQYTYSPEELCIKNQDVSSEEDIDWDKVNRCVKRIERKRRQNFNVQPKQPMIGGTCASLGPTYFESCCKKKLDQGIQDSSCSLTL